MSALAPLLESLSGPAMGAAATGLVWALARAVQRRGEASAKLQEAAAAQDQASAAGVLAMVGQLAKLNERCEALEAEVTGLRNDLEAANEERTSEREMRLHFEQLAKSLTEKCAVLEAAGAQLRREYDASLLKSLPSTKSWRPPGKR